MKTALAGIVVIFAIDSAAAGNPVGLSLWGQNPAACRKAASRLLQESAPIPATTTFNATGPGADTLELSANASVAARETHASSGDFKSPATLATGSDALAALNMNYVYMVNKGQSPVVLSLATQQFGKVEDGKFVPLPEDQLPPEGYLGGSEGIHFGSLQGPASLPAPVDLARYASNVNDPILAGPNGLKMTAAIAQTDSGNPGLERLKEVARDFVIGATTLGVLNSLASDPRLTAEEIKAATTPKSGVKWGVVKNGLLHLVNLPIEGLEAMVKLLPKSTAEPILKGLANRKTMPTLVVGTGLFEVSKFLVHQEFMHKFLGLGAGYLKPFLPGLTNRYEMGGGEMWLTLNRTYSLFDPLNEHEAVEFQERDTGKIINRMWGPVDKPGSPKWNFYMKTLGRERLPPLRQAKAPPVPLNLVWTLWQVQRSGQVRSFAVTDELNREDHSRMTAAGIPVQRTRQVDAVPEVIMGFGGRPTGHLRLHKTDGGIEDVPLSLVRPWSAPFVREHSPIQKKVESGGYSTRPLPSPAATGPLFAGNGQATPGGMPVNIVFSSPELQQQFYNALILDPRFEQFYESSSEGGTALKFGGAKLPSGRSARDWVEAAWNKTVREVNRRALKVLPPKLVSVSNVATNTMLVLSVDQLLQYLLHAGHDRGIGSFYSHMNIPGLYEQMPSPDGDGTTTTKRVGSATANTARGDSLVESVSLEGKYGHGARVTFFYGNQDYSGLQFNFDEQKPLTLKDLVDHVFKMAEMQRNGVRGDQHLKMALNGQVASPYVEPIYKNLNKWGNFQDLAHPNDQIGPLRFDEPYVGPRLTARDDAWARSLEASQAQSASGRPAMVSFRYEFPNPRVPLGVQEIPVSGTVLEVARSIHGVPLWVKINSPVYGVQVYDFPLMRFGRELPGNVDPSAQFTQQSLRNNSASPN